MEFPSSTVGAEEPVNEAGISLSVYLMSNCNETQTVSYNLAFQNESDQHITKMNYPF